MQVEVTATAGDHVVEVPRTATTALNTPSPLVGMRAERPMSSTSRLFDETGAPSRSVDAAEFTTIALPPWFDEHELTIDEDRAAPGYTIVEFDTLRIPEGAPSSQHLMAYDNDGEVVWYYTNTGALGGVEPTPAGTFNMFYWPFGIREVDILGNVVNNWRPQPADATGDTVDDELVVAEVDPDQVQFQGGLPALEGNPGDAEPTPIRADWIDLIGVHHESWPMPNGNVLTLSTTVHELTPEQRATFCPDDPAPFNAISDVAVEFEPDGTVVRTWDLWDVIDIDEHPGSRVVRRRRHLRRDEHPRLDPRQQRRSTTRSATRSSSRRATPTRSSHSTTSTTRARSHSCAGSSATGRRCRSTASRPTTSTPSR